MHTIGSVFSVLRRKKKKIRDKKLFVEFLINVRVCVCVEQGSAHHVYTSNCHTSEISLHSFDLEVTS